MRTRAAHTLAAVAVLAAAACASGAAQAAQGPAPVRPGEQSGLGIVGQETPELLKQIKADPYVAPAGPVCVAAPAELARLDEVLGPDADVPQADKGTSPGEMMGKAVRALVPHRGLIRMVTGADKKDKELTDAAMAASARRGYLKGLMRQAHCGEPMEATTTAASASLPPSDPIGARLDVAASAPAASETATQASTLASDATPTPAPSFRPSEGVIAVNVAGSAYGPTR